MSLIPIGISVAIAAAENLINPFFLQQSSIAGMVPDVTVEERHLDELVVTEHPVEQNAAITDHSYKRPVSCTLRAGWSNSSLASGGDPTYVQQIYQQLVTLQASRQPFTIVTVKRLYSNMLLVRLQTETDQKTANAMVVTADCREVIIVSTSTVTLPPAANMKSPELNAPPINKGAQQVQPAPNFNPAAVSQ